MNIVIDASVCLKWLFAEEDSPSLKFLKFFLKSKPQLVSIADEYKTCLTLAKKYRLSAYDSSYLTLTKAAKTILVSADEKLVRKVADNKLVIGLAEYVTATRSD